MIVERGFERWRLTKEAQDLRRQKEEVERRFITLVSHQLKTPLVAVKQYLDVLLFSHRDQLPEKALEWVSRSQLRLGEMLTLIQDWLALAKIDSGCYCDQNASCSLALIVHSIVEEQQQLPAAAAISIQAVIPPDLPPVCGDPVSISILVSNVVGNAVKYNRPGGSVAINAAPGENQVTLEVSDTGIGIPEECIPKLFHEFYRVKTEQTRGIPGTGLGLVICNRIVTELGGSMEIRSREGLGTTLLVHLAVAKTAPQQKPSSETHQGENK